MRRVGICIRTDVAAAATVVGVVRRRTHTRPDAAMLDFGCGTGSHSHFQFVTVSQTAAGRRLARTPLAGRPAGSRRVFNKLLVIYISAAVICVPSATARAGRCSPIPTSPLPTCGRDMRRRRSRGAGRIVHIYIYVGKDRSQASAGLWRPSRKRRGPSIIIFWVYIGTYRYV